MRHPYRTSLLAATAVVLCSCSSMQPFRLLLTVVEKGTGKPVTGVRVRLDVLGREAQKDDLEYGSAIDTATGDRTPEDIAFQFPSYPTLAQHWYLKLSKPGFDPVITDIRPDPLPERSNDPIELRVTVEMVRNGSEGPTLP